MTKIFSGRNRKGFVTDMQLAIIAVVTLIVLSVFAFKVYTTYKEKLSIQSCKNSIEAHSLIAKGSFREIFTDIKCPTKEINIKDLDKSKELIAEDMHRCWYIWGQGKGQYFQGDGNYCYVCSIYSFNDKGQRISGLMNYLAKTPIKIKYAGDKPGVTYMDYLTGKTTTNAFNEIERTMPDTINGNSINTSQQYATIFVYTSDKPWMQKMLEGNRVATGTAGLAIAGTGTLAVIAGVGGATFLISNPVGWFVGGAIVLGSALAGGALTVDEPETMQMIVFRPYNGEELNKLQCDQMVVNQMTSAAR